MNTRTERMNNKAYCAYCGKELRDYNYGVCPEPSLVCNCEKANRELELYGELKALYNAPIAEILIDMKVEEYKNKLLGINIPTYTSITSISSPTSVKVGSVLENISGCVCLD